jgi:small subunit ribosomal protein S15
MLKKGAKTRIIKTSQAHKKDTGSAGVQISLLSAKINKLSLHLKTNQKDNHSRRGLLQMVAKRKKLANYLKKNDSKLLDKLAKKYKFKA